METVAEQVRRFERHYAGHIECVATDLPSDDDALYSRIILTTLLDTLSSYAFEDKQVGARFVAFVSQFSGWEHAEHVSLFHLSRALEVHQQPEFSNLKLWAESELEAALPAEPEPSLIAHTSVREKRLAVDPTLETVLTEWPKNQGTPLNLGGFQAKHFTHAQLLYQYRNHLVHEFRVPGYGWEVDRTVEPFYQKQVTKLAADLKPLAERWELVYPLKFLLELCRTSLARLSKALLEEGRRPFSGRLEGSYWIRSLN